MPIEIRELEINVTVTDDAAKTPPKPGASDIGAPSDPGAIVALCVDKVMELLREQKED